MSIPPTRRRAPPFLSLACALLLTAVSGGAVAASSPYVVSLDVMAEGEDAVKAKAEALEQGMAEALRTVAERVAVGERVPEASPAEADALVASYSFEHESIGARSYGARITVKFDPEGVRRFLQAHGNRVVDQQAPAVLVVPVLVEGGQPRLWDGAEPWAEAIAAEEPGENLAPLLLPENGRSDQDLDRDYLLSLAQLEVTELRMRYRAHSVLLAIAEPQEEAVRLTLRGEDAAGLVQTSIDVPGGLEDAAKAAVDLLQQRWKRALGGGAVAAGEGLAELRGALGELPGSEAPPVPIEAVPVRVLLRGQDEWHVIRQRLEASGGIAGLSVDYLEPGLAEIRIWPRTGPDQLSAALARLGLDLFRAGETWMLQAY